MQFYQIRLKRFPEFYLPKKGITYTLKSDQLIAAIVEQNYNGRHSNIDAVLRVNDDWHPYVKQKAARTYTDRKQVESARRNYGFLNPDFEVGGKKYSNDEQSFSEFEVVEYPSGKIIPFDDFKS